MGEIDWVVLAFGLVGLMGLVVVLPGVLAWRVGRGRSWGRAALALLGPGVAGYGLLVLGWVWQYEGRCGGWLGETTACGWGQYAVETLFWGAMTLAMPGLLGLVVGGAVLAGRRSWVKR
jgi:hypothetical protein